MIWLSVSFVVGTVLGSFVKALADRSLSERSFWGRSYCQFCKHKLTWYDLIPIISYLFLRGKCRYCKRKIGVEYLVVEVVMGVLIAFLFWQQSSNVQCTMYNVQCTIFILDLLFKTFFVTVLAVLFITDLKEMFIPDRIVIPAIVITLIYLVITALTKIWYLYSSLSQSQLGRLLLSPNIDYFQRHAFITAYPLFGSLIMALLIGGLFAFLIIITKGKGMGGGDVKLGTLMGLALGFPNSLVALMFSFLSGAIIALVLVFLKKKHFGQSIPFGPFLVLGSLVALFWGNIIIDWYLKIGS